MNAKFKIFFSHLYQHILFQNYFEQNLPNSCSKTKKIHLSNVTPKIVHKTRISPRRTRPYFCLQSIVLAYSSQVPN